MTRSPSLRRNLVAAFAAVGLAAAMSTAVVPAQAATTGILPSATTVTPSVVQAPVGTAVTLSSKVSVLGTGLIIIPTGSVTYTAVNSTGTHVLGSAPLTGCLLTPCSASLTTTALGVGANAITASYGGNGPTLITITGIGSGNNTNTVVLVGPSSATTNVFMTQPPSAPQNLVVSAGDGKNTLTWSPPSDEGSSPVTKYTISRAVGTGPYTTLSAVNAPTTTYVDTPLTNGTTYSYKVTARNAAGDGPASAPASGTPQAALSVPSAPTLTATGQVASIKLHWTVASDGGSAVSAYKLYRRVSGPGAFTLIASEPTGDYQDTTVIVGVSYDYQASAVNGIGESPMSNIATASATPFAGPSSAQTESCPAGSPCTSSTATAVDPATGNATDSSIEVESSSGPHTATVAVGGPMLTGCTTAAAVGLSSTFNDTSTDAFKVVHWILNGTDANTWWNANNPTPSYGELCLGLGTQWFNGQGGPVVWVPADGLWEGRVVACANNGSYWLGGVHYSQPCYDSIAYAGGLGFNKIDFTLRLPPGDGKIGGGH